MQDPSDDLGKLAELVRQLERYVEHQIRATEELDDKLEQFLAIILAIAAGGVAILATSPPPAQPIETAFLTLVGLGLLASLLAGFTLVDAYVGLTAGRAPRIHPGTDPDWLADVALEPAWSLPHVLHATVKGLRQRAEENQRELNKSATARRAALHLTLLALVLSGAAIFLRWQLQ